jgi:3-hydroxyacyl-CoA dehydrogenase/enoyl-CoA hydratase/3-hydroxybutyryl-CoA epimerase
MEKYRHFSLTEDEHRFIHLYFDYADGSMNVLSSAVILELKDILEDIKNRKSRGLAFHSGKSNGFIAGANVKEFTKLRDFDDALRVIQIGQRVMTMLDDLPFPTVAVINGICLGGGLELALACDYRIALDSQKTRLGLPEVKLGIHPGFGGMVRSVRVLGPVKAMGLMLTGRTLAAQQARKMGLVDYVVPQRLLDKSVVEVLKEKPKQSRPSRIERFMNHKRVRNIVANRMRKEVAKSARQEHYPAPYEMINVWNQHSGDEKGFMLAEAKSAAKLAMTPTARSLLRVFMLQDLMKSSGDKSTIDPKHVHVIGAGAMGGDIAAWCALRGFTVTLQDISEEMIGDAIKRAHKLYSKRFRGKDHLINEVLDRLVPDKNGDGVPFADVVIEAVVENIEIKRGIYGTLEPLMKQDAILATNTSSIKLEVLSEKMNHPERLVGLHFFNPVAKMPLVEVVYTKNENGAFHSRDTDPEVVERAAGFCRHIDKLPVRVKSSPGFLVNRVLMPTLIEAINMLDEGISREDIDNAFLNFGMPMGPLHLADTVGLDVCYFVMNIICEDLGLEVPKRLEKMIKKKKLGIKSGSGFYKYSKGKKKSGVSDHLTSKRNIEEVKDRLVRKLISECQKCLDEGIVESADHVDAGIIFGAGFAPFRGGPLHFASQDGR